MTLRKRIIELLGAECWTARELSRALRISEKEVLGHLEHVSRSIKHTFGIEPPKCLACGFTFRTRSHMRCPSRCPRCKSEHIQEPRFYQKNVQHVK